MRASSEPNDSGYCNLSRHKYLHVYLDGELVKEPITADEELGYVKYSLCDSEGQLVVIDGATITQEKHGKVVIKASNRLTRVSVEENDNGYCAEAFGDVKIFLDDELVEFAITADEELGYVKCFQLDMDGNTIIEGEGKDAHAVEVEKYGKVRIEIIEE